MRANLLFSRSEVERSELKNSTVYKLSVIGLGNTATVCVCVCVCVYSRGCKFATELGFNLRLVE